MDNLLQAYDRFAHCAPVFTTSPERLICEIYKQDEQIHYHTYSAGSSTPIVQTFYLYHYITDYGFQLIVNKILPADQPALVTNDIDKIVAYKDFLVAHFGQHITVAEILELLA